MNRGLIDLVDIALEYNIKYTDVVQVHNNFTVRYFNQNNIPLVTMIGKDYSIIENHVSKLTDRYFSIYTQTKSKTNSEDKQ